MFDPSAVVTCDAELEAVVGTRPGAMMLKSIRYLDEHCERFLACSPFAVIGTTTSAGSLQTIALGGEPGFAAPGPTPCSSSATCPPVADPNLFPVYPSGSLVEGKGTSEPLGWSSSDFLVPIIEAVGG